MKSRYTAVLSFYGQQVTSQAHHDLTSLTASVLALIEDTGGGMSGTIIDNHAGRIIRRCCMHKINH